MIFRRRKAPAIWRGIYDRFADVPASADVHASQAWLDVLEHDRDAVRSGAVSDDFVLEHEALLLVLRSAAAPQRVVDFGGGLASSYEWLKRCGAAIAEWRVIELPMVVSRGRELVRDDGVVRFETSIDGTADVVFVKSALQYVDQWADTARRLFALNARFVILEKFSGTSSRTYATAQLNLGETVTPYWVIAFEDLFRIATECGYERLLWRRLPRIYDQAEFPPDLRIGQASTLVFGRPVSSRR